MMMFAGVGSGPTATRSAEQLDLTFYCALGRVNLFHCRRDHTSCRTLHAMKYAHTDLGHPVHRSCLVSDLDCAMSVKPSTP